jgi:hypothetical protein
MLNATEEEKIESQEKWLYGDLNTMQCELERVEYDTDLIKLEKRIITKYFKKRILSLQTEIASLHNAEVKDYFDLDEDNVEKWGI